MAGVLKSHALFYPFPLIPAEAEIQQMNPHNENSQKKDWAPACHRGRQTVRGDHRIYMKQGLTSNPCEL
ncbi:MAG: hypothetical protein A2977_01825 [Alphaproteobacteria bacterium RIFCSPLOWO2_01_FULL_45_8]|nr:MAG: hypothetical protein A2065_01385 [Alphaproteobacteria bacterium GWB1_45_5]OFW76143.1 MAG: hypothetical protein A3K20_02850 [Alphaproteobacteria bacterium GWA1_45_9]OFW89567.1 MAG: hypothetical protein A2621_01450 [Alphaproteobacteria bacterium RIFCSPHIGHO2_01_FULL_41_14]OFW96200.1 MAG: hypothetical protein A2977_01825 [Alphaproteobacteria bacterium RIFCSPLOWO2_01_FULL_45_8]HCI48470.1 hypothetical protein [Holosporales bacterium]